VAVLRGAGAALVLTLLISRAALAAEERSVLLIYADPRLSPAITKLDETLRVTIGGRAPYSLRFDTEYLDLSWFPQGQERYIRQAMREKYTGRTFDLVIPCGEAALRFALRERDALFPDVPIVFCGVEDGSLRDMKIPPDVTGVTMFRDWSAGLDLIMRLHPGTQRIAFVGGASAIERGWEQLAREVFTRTPHRVSFTYITGLPIEETEAALLALPHDAVIIMNVFLLDGAGRPFSSPEALRRLAPSAQVPMYGFTDMQLGHGIVGGPLVSYEAQAQQAGALALRVLAGERLGRADIVRRVPYRFTFDARELARWRIREGRLPPDSLVEFRPGSLWRDYRWYVAGAIVFAVAQAVLIAGLLFARRQRRRVARRLDERLRFEMLLADLAAAFVEIPAQEIDERIADGLRRTVDELGLDRARLAELVPSGDEFRVTHVQGRDGVAPAPVVFTAAEWPWTLGRLREGQSVSIARLADLPAQAARDRESFAALGTTAIIILPLLVDGVVVGGLACSMAHREREWPPELVHRLRLLAHIFAVVLMRQRADRALEASESRFRELADAAPVMMWVAGPDGGCTDFNRTWLRFTGRMLADEVGDGWLEGVHPEDRESCRKSYRSALDARTPFTIEYRLRRADGVYRSILDSGVPRFDGDTFRGFVGSAVDVTDVKAAQQALVESLALRSAIVGSLYGQLAALDRHGVIVAVNEAWTQFLQTHGGDVRTAGVGANYLDVCRRAVATGDPHARAALDAIQSVLAGRSERALVEYPCATSSETQWYAMVVEPFKRPQGGLVISHINVTRRRRAEEDAQRERDDLAHALRVAAMGYLATSLAHEINQPLAAIATNAQAARRLVESAPVDPDVLDALSDITDAAQRAAQVIRRLRVLFKKESGDPQPVDLTEVIKEVIGLLHKDLERRRVRVHVSLPHDPPRVRGDVVQLQQVILNVVVNAAEAMAGTVHPRELRITASALEPGILSITVSDTGPGVAASELEHIFERFVSTKPDGLGMGLSISRSIIKAHGGRMWATRNPDRGLTMHIELPYIED
jgi:PAS domain S-box-containing protein